eukprot:1218191-Rhodomonas_salina.5
MVIPAPVLTFAYGALTFAYGAPGISSCGGRLDAFDAQNHCGRVGESVARTLEARVRTLSAYAPATPCPVLT